MKVRSWFAFLVLSLSACGGSRPPAPPVGTTAAAPDTAAPAAAAAAVPDAPKLRLPRNVLPEQNRARLILDPAKDTFTGRIDIVANVAEATDFFWLNATDIQVHKATVTVGGDAWTLEVSPQKKDFVGFRAPRTIPAGKVTISVDYEGKLDDTETHGIFRQKEGDHWYAFTQFEPTDARRAFPCFDEPDNKVPWQVTLEVPDDTVALSNTPVVSEGKGEKGRKVVAFAQTKPLPSYLVAFAVGPFDVVDAGQTRHGTPMRVVVSRGRGGDVGYVVETTGEILALLEDYFGMPYPYEKLDTVGIPLTVGYGAMEHPGLITYQQGILVARPEDRSIGYERRYVDIAAHELAHQWFGNLVTMKFWDDTWLNEAFASWSGDKIVHQYKPEWDGDVGFVNRRSGAIGADSLQNARRIRQPIKNDNDIQNAFDGITYSKGAAVIQMFESWLGEETFRDGVRHYLKKHAWGNASADDFLEAVGEVANKDVRTPFSTYLDQVGAPLLSFALRCERGETPSVTMTQERYLPQGSLADADRIWQVPVCVAYPARGKKQGRDCTLLTEKTATLELSQARSCPAWVLPNDGMEGYYRSAFEGDLLEKLLNRGMRSLTLAEQVGVVGDVNALVTAGKVDYGVALGLVARMARDDSRHIVGQAAGITAGIAEMVPDELRSRYARFVRKMFGARAHRLGWTPKPGEDEDTRLLRNTLLGLVTDQGEDRKLAGEAQKLALAWLEDHDAVDPNMVDLVLGTAARVGDADLWERFYEEAKKAEDRRDRQRLLGALAGFRDPDLVKRAMGLVLGGEFDIRESIGLLFGGLSDRYNRKMVYDYVRENYDAIAEKMPKQFQAYLVYVGVAQCDASLKEEIEAFFKPRSEKLPGGPRTYAQAMEQLDLCVVSRAAQTPSVVAFLEKH